MSAFLSYFLTALINVFISFVVCTSVSVYLLSSGINIDPFGPIINPVSKSFKLGATIGILHGLVTIGIIYWYKSESVIGNGISAFVATEVLLLTAIMYFILSNITVSSIIFHFRDLSFVLINFFGWFLILSVVLCIPSFLVGLLAGIIRLKLIISN